jgi:hypothetical protein
LTKEGVALPVKPPSANVASPIDGGHHRHSPASPTVPFLPVCTTHTTLHMWNADRLYGI